MCSFDSGKAKTKGKRFLRRNKLRGLVIGGLNCISQYKIVGLETPFNILSTEEVCLFILGVGWCLPHEKHSYHKHTKQQTGLLQIMHNLVNLS